MSALIAAELLKLRVTRTTWVLLAVAVALSAARVAQVLSSTGTAAGIERGTGEATLTLAGAAGTGTLLALFLGVMAGTGEFRHRTMTGTLLMTPQRRQVVVAKALALTAVGSAMALALSAFGVLVAVLTGAAGAVGVGSGLRAVVAVAAGGAFWAWLGLGVGLVVRNQTVALLMPVGWLLILEPLVGSFGLDSLAPWLPGALPGVLVGFESVGSPPVWAAVIAVVGYGLALSVVGARRLDRLDVT